MTRADQPSNGDDSGGHDLGVLFVHGIGHQAAGDTLVQFGDPVVRWMIEWFEWARRTEAAEYTKSTGKKEADFTDEEKATLKWGWIEVNRTTVKAEGGISAHAEMTLGISSRPGRLNHWLVAESWWANAFAAPTFSALAFWGLVVYPWTNASHFGSQIRRVWNRAHESNRVLALIAAGMLTPVYFVGSVAVSIIVLALLVFLLVLAIPPVPSMRNFLLRIQQRLADNLGDSFILVASPIQKAAIVSHVRRDLEWLVTQGCRKIAVVAHSQGAAVAYETLMTGVVEGRLPGDTLFITFGSGLGKLREVERAMTSDKAQMGWAPILGLTLIAASLEFFGLVDVVPFAEPSVALGLFCVLFGLVFWIAGVVHSAWENSLDPKDFDPARKFGAPVVWRDYYASDDPVSNGPLFDQDPAFMKSQEVHNRAAPWSDHTTYWLNRDEFVPHIVGDLGSFSQLPLLNLRTDDEARVAMAARRRKWRVRWLAVARITACLAAVLIILVRLSDVRDWGVALFAQVPAVERMLGWIGGEALGSGRLAADPAAQYIAGMALVAGCVAAAYHVLYLVWQVWSWRDSRTLLRREDYVSEASYWTFVLAFLSLANAALLVTLGWLGPSAPLEVRGGIAFWPWYLVFPGITAGVGVFVFQSVMRRAPPFSAAVPESLTAALVIAPLMAIMMMAGLDEKSKLGALVGLIVLAGLLISYLGARMLPEHQGWK